MKFLYNVKHQKVLKAAALLKQSIGVLQNAGSDTTLKDCVEKPDKVKRMLKY